MEQRTKKIGLVGLALIGVAGFLNSCRDNNSYRGTYRGYYINKSIDQGFRGTMLVIYENGKDRGYICAIDEDYDGRYDNIKLVNIQRGSEIEKLASLETIQEIDKQIMPTVEKVEENKR